MDGTLIDTETLARDLFIRACLEIGCECKIEIYEETIGLNVRQAHELFLDRLGSDYPYVEIRKLTSKWFSERIKDSPVATKEGSLILLDTLASLNIKIGLCTSTGRKSVEICLDHLGFSRYFSEMVCGGESEEGKPHPSPYLNIARKMSIKPSNSWAIEDSRNGLRSASSAGYQVLHVPDHNSSSHDMSDMTVITYVSLADIAREVKQIGA